MIELENGESDRSMWLRYLEGEGAEQACIKFSDNYYPVDRYERKKIKEVCASIEPIKVGTVDYGGSSPSKKVSTGEVVEVTGIW